MTSKEYNSGF